MPQVAISCNVRKQPPQVLSGRSLHCLQHGEFGSFTTVSVLPESLSADGLLGLLILILAIQDTTFCFPEYRFLTLNRLDRLSTNLPRTER